MAKTTKHIFYDVSVVVNGVDLDDHIESAEITVGINAQRADAQGDAQEYSMPGKQQIRGIRLNFYQDYATAKVYQTLIAAYSARSTFNLVCKPDSGATAADNPQWTISTFIGEMPLMAGSQGERHMAPVTLEPAGILAIATA